MNTDYIDGTHYVEFCGLLWTYDNFLEAKARVESLNPANDWRA